MNDETSNECDVCAGCGKVTNDDDRTPWKYWDELPAQSRVAVTMGWVRPLTCERCHGTGRLVTAPTPAEGAT